MVKVTIKDVDVICERLDMLEERIDELQGWFVFHVQSDFEKEASVQSTEHSPLDVWRKKDEERKESSAD
ncbi:MAG: hypothetical protein J6U51_01525 [Bacteroidales bacterium]|nr:hypothetical protein [Bacteroidales bacterium]